MERDGERLYKCISLLFTLYTRISLYAVYNNVIQVVLSPDPVVMGTLKQTSSPYDISHDTHMKQISL